MTRCALLLAFVLALTSMGTIVRASPARTGAWASGHLFGGRTQTDPKLARFDWDTGARPAFGADFAAGWKRIGFGLRFITGQNEQQTENPLVSYSARVRSRTFELTAPVRLLDLFGFGISGCGSLGRMWLSYDPDHVEIPVANAEPLRVGLDPIDAWTASAGGSIHHAVSGPLELGMSARHRWFELDTAHRVGDGISYESQRFGQWEVQLEVGWTVDL